MRCVTFKNIPKGLFYHVIAANGAMSFAKLAVENQRFQAQGIIESSSPPSPSILSMDTPAVIFHRHIYLVRYR